MKTAFYVATLLIFLTAIASCTTRGDSGMTAVEVAERAFDEHRYAKAQNIADSIMLGSTFSRLNATELCRLSLLFTRLSEKSTNAEANTAMATRALEAAFRLDSDSTTLYIHTVPLDDRAQMAIINALTKSHDEGDSIILESDSI